MGKRPTYEPPEVPTTVYAVRCGDYQKIGIAGDFAMRLTQLRMATPYPVEVVATREFPTRQIAIWVECFGLMYQTHQGSGMRERSKGDPPMPYRIDYYKDSKSVGSSPYAGSLNKTKQVAQDGLIRHSADNALIVDDDTKTVVATVARRLPPSTPTPTAKTKE